MDMIILKITLIGAAGIGAQWLAWRTRVPAIVLLLLGGLVLGPVSGFLSPAEDFGHLLRPAIAVAVAIILFEGGLTLNFSELKGTSKAIKRLVFLAAPVTWVVGSYAAHHVAGLSWPVAIVFSGILVVTGPTVIMPLLRQAGLSPRPAAILRWEAIIADPLGALFAVIAFEFILITTSGHTPLELGLRLTGAIILGLLGGYLFGRAIVWAFTRGLVPDYLKAPVLLAIVLIGYEITNLVLEEAGLITVTIMGLTLANSRIAALSELRRFKEFMTVVLVSGVFIILTATLDMQMIMQLDAGAFAYLALLLFVIRPIVTLLTTIGSELSLKERLLIGWIAPRGVVAVAVSGLFGTALVTQGYADGAKLVPLAFLVVFATVILHGFSIRPLAKLLDLSSGAGTGILIIGGNPWTTELGKRLAEQDIPVRIADGNWNNLHSARQAGLPIFYGEILNEAAEHHIDFNQFGTLIAATSNDAYNALVCTDFGPELGRSNVFQTGRKETDLPNRKAMSFTLGGRPLLPESMDARTLNDYIREGWTMQKTTLSEAYNYETFLAERDDQTMPLIAVNNKAEPVALYKQSGYTPQAGHTIISFGPGRPSEPDAESTSS